METYGFFDAEQQLDDSWDREYLAEQFANYFKLFVGNGVFTTPTNQLKVRAGSGMNIIISTGWAFINGYWYYNDSDLELTVPANMTAATVTDGVFVRWDSSERTITAHIEHNRSEVDRVPPYYELKLADITVRTAATAIADADITDTRPDASVCGFVSGIIDVIDAGDLFSQFTSIFTQWLETVQDEMELDFNEFDAWFQHMKDQLDEDAAGHLQNEIDALTPVILTQTLSAGDTTLTFTDENILDTSLIDIYTDVYGVTPAEISTNNNTCVLTFYEQENDVSVKLVIKN